MVGQLFLKRGFQHRLGQPGQHPARTDQVHSLLPGLADQALSELLLLVLIELHRLEHVGHQTCFPTKPLTARRVQARTRPTPLVGQSRP